MAYLGNKQAINSGLLIIGGLKTKAHLRSGGYRLDFARSCKGINHALYPMDFVLERWNGDLTVIRNGKKVMVNSGNYAIYRLTGTDYYAFYIHNRLNTKFKRGHIDRGEKFFEPHRTFGPHLHIKIGGYSSKIKKYLPYLEYLDPKIYVRTNYGSKAYTGKNKGKHLPGTPKNFISENDYEMIQLQEPIPITTTNTGKLNIRKDPSTNSKILATLEKQTKLICKTIAKGKNIAGISTWYQLEYSPKRFGWIHGKFVRMDYISNERYKIMSEKAEALQKEFDNVKVERLSLVDKIRTLEMKIENYSRELRHLNEWKKTLIYKLYIMFKNRGRSSTA